MYLLQIIIKSLLKIVLLLLTFDQRNEPTRNELRYPKNWNHTEKKINDESRSFCFSVA